ncbi:unnamed protein product [Vicia faba]|uniref:SHSP domain-containing protein n=1 Tax=Vicia faba TaxID=3906 RepID=A0AAV0Z5U9_VICFA|nr:unnamed protein product [Vicia faba]
MINMSMIRVSPKTLRQRIQVIDVPGLKSGDIKVHVEDYDVLVISGERKMKGDKEGAKYLRIETMVGKYMHKFVLLENANINVVSAVCQGGVLSVTVETLPPSQPKKLNTIEV